jgi:protein-disulfide isomerase
VRARGYGRGAIVVALAAAIGCHGSRDGRATAQAQGAAATAPDAATSFADEVWAHTKQVFRVPVGDSPAQGPATALVTIIEFSQFGSAPCASMDAALRSLRAKYGDQVRLVWKNKPVGAQRGAELAAEAALEARSEKGDAAFWLVHDRLVDHLAEWAHGDRVDVGAIAGIARDAGASAEEVRRAMERHTHRREIEEDLDLAEDFEVEGAPHVFINGRQLAGPQPVARIERMVDEEIARARALAFAGVAADSIYESATAGGTEPWRARTVRVPVLPGNDPVLGAADAPVTVHVFSDYQCALCNAVERRIADLRKTRGAQTRWVWHDLPLPRHKDARLFAQAAREAYAQKGAAGFWAMHDTIANAPNAPGETELDGFASDLKLDRARWRAGIAAGGYAQAIDAERTAAAAAGITETPAFLVVARGEAEGALVGSSEYGSKLERVVEQALERGDREEAERE